MYELRHYSFEILIGFSLVFSSQKHRFSIEFEIQTQVVTDPTKITTDKKNHEYNILWKQCYKNMK